MHDVSKLTDLESVNDQPPEVMFNILSLLYNVLRVYFLVWISDAVIEEAHKTGRILCGTASFKIEKKIKESVSG